MATARLQPINNGADKHKHTSIRGDVYQVQTRAKLKFTTLKRHSRLKRVLQDVECERKIKRAKRKTAINHVLGSMLPNQTKRDDGKSQNRQAKCVISLITALNVAK